jgi:hypothetical protein
MVVVHQVGGDPEQPRTRIGVGGVEARALVEGAGERLGREVLGQRRSDAAVQPPMDPREVTFEQRGERLRVADRCCEDRRVGGLRRRIVVDLQHRCHRP